MRTLFRTALVALLAGGAAAFAPAQPPAGAVKSRLKITVPKADAELTIESAVMKATGKVREFETRPSSPRGPTTSTASEPSGSQTTTPP